MNEPYAEYKVVTSTGYTYDPIEQMGSESMRLKREFIEKFLKTNYHYPGETGAYEMPATISCGE